ncbi:VanW family protein [Psychrobacillus sp. MER TA 171]|uniref:VanW family protein n=1 Tax=Psychrobacillus sp. MER TA 171 TaxID=2939577 RepID=UPI0020402A40|nr:VanW family protein [Psychrobacillus sp. MER TA 171]MCM3357814.1 VanW family protein [Psychrobacillus sp. MER TA 171]
MRKIILISIVFVLFSIVILNGVANAEKKTDGGSSTIGGVTIETKDREEVIALLNEEIAKWKERPIILKTLAKEIVLDPNSFSFNVEYSSQSYIDATSNAWFKFWKKDAEVNLPLTVEIDESLIEMLAQYPSLNIEKTIENIKRSVENLVSTPIEAVELDYTILESERIAFSLESVTQNLVGQADIIEALNDVVIPEGQTFSLLTKLQESNVPYNDATMDFIASLLYATVLQTNFEIVERHSQGIIPSYLEPGIEADVESDFSKDFKFINSIQLPVVLKVGIKGNEILVEFYTAQSEIKGTYEVLEKEIVNPRTIYRYSNSLKEGEEELVQEGEPGLRVTVYRTVADKIGPYELQEVISKDYYPPKHRIVLTSIKTSVSAGSNTLTDIDLNGDGLPDIEETDKGPSNTPDSPNSEQTGELPEGSYYDKAGNIITPK